MRTTTVLSVCLIALAAACGSSDDEADPQASSGPEPGSLEAIVQALECEEETTMSSDGEALYSCLYSEREDLSMIYVYVFDQNGRAQTYAESRVDFRAEDEKPRGIAWSENWVIDTYSEAAMAVAEEQGAEVLIPAVDE